MNLHIHHGDRAAIAGYTDVHSEEMLSARQRWVLGLNRRGAAASIEGPVLAAT